MTIVRLSSTLHCHAQDGSVEVSEARLRAVFHVAPANDDLIWLA